MQTAVRKNKLLFCVFAFSATTALIVGLSSPMKAQQEPPLKRLMRGRHRLLRRVYVNSPDCDVKGLAASIKADEITCKHRIRAVRYLSTVDSVEYPEAKQMLVETMHTDKWEIVRFEAARSLRVMMSGGADSRANSPRLFRRWFRLWRRHTRRSWRRQVTGRRDYWVQVCDSQTLGALVRTAYEQDCNGVCFEPSLRVREMAVAAIVASGVECNVGPYKVGGNQALSAMPVLRDSKLYWSEPDNFDSLAPFAQGGDEFIELGDYHATSDKKASVQLAAGQIDVEWQPASKPATQSEPERATADDFAFGEAADFSEFDPNDFGPLTAQEQRLFEEPEPEVEPVDVPLDRTIPALNGFCVVELRRSKNRVPASSQHQVRYAGRLYEFSTAFAQRLFEASPDRYAVAYGGFDPVNFAHSGRMVEGQVLCEHGGRLYAFGNRENRQQFLQNPAPYSLQAITDAPTFDLDVKEPAQPIVAAKPSDSNHKRAQQEPVFAADSLTLIPPPPPLDAKTSPAVEDRAASEADLADMDFGVTEDGLAAARRVLQPVPEEAAATPIVKGNEPDATLESPPWDDEPEPEFASTADWYEGFEEPNPVGPPPSVEQGAEEAPLAAEPPGPNEIALDPASVFGEEPAVSQDAETDVKLFDRMPWTGNWQESEFYRSSGPADSTGAGLWSDKPAAPRKQHEPEHERFESRRDELDPQRVRPKVLIDGWKSADPRVGRNTRRSYFDSALRIPERGFQVTPITASAKRTPSGITSRRITGWSQPVKPVSRSQASSLAQHRPRVAAVRPNPNQSKTRAVRPHLNSPSSALTRSRSRSTSADRIQRVSTSQRSSGSVRVFSVTGRKKENGVRHADGEPR